jgi:hypothetical protein
MITAAEFRHGCCGQGTQVEIRWWSSPWWQSPLQCGQRGHSVVVPGWLQLGVSNCPFVAPTGVWVHRRVIRLSLHDGGSGLLRRFATMAAKNKCFAQSNKLPSGGLADLAKQGARLVHNCHEKSASAHVAGLQCSNDRDIERDHPQGTGLTGDAAARESRQRQYGRGYEDEDAKGQPEPYSEQRADDCERSHVGPQLS